MLYATTTFLSAFLLFMVQLLMGKLLLPWFGGTPAVWTTCMLFFQLTLLAGYAYTHLTSSRLKPSTQVKLHVALLATAVALMAFWSFRWGSPILPDESWKPDPGDAPQPLILSLLAASIGLPFLLLSATSPLLQRWFALAGAGDKTYRLYAVSNAGSLLGLLAYPFLVERFLALPVQAVLWAVAFVTFSACCTVCALLSRKQSSARAPAAPSPAPDIPAPRPNISTILTWLALSTATSASLLSVTNELCQEIAAVPFLWMLPLVIYLLSFIVCFDHPRWYRRRPYLVAAALLTVVVLVTASLGISLNVPVHITSFSLFLFAFCMLCHGELVALKPDPAHLTAFYLTIAVGGAAGGLFVGLAAPHLFTAYWEFNITVTLAWAALAFIFLRDRKSPFHTGDWLHLTAFLAIALYLSTRVVLTFTRTGMGWATSLAVPALASLPLALALTWPLRRTRFARSKLWPRLLVGTVVFLAECFMVMRIRELGEHTVAAERNFFGTIRVQLYPPEEHGEITIPPHVQLTHGRINHGYQFLDDTLRYKPVTYYGPGSGINTAVSFHPRRTRDPQNPQPLHIGVLGLGAGTMAAFAEPGDTVTFYEINPAVTDYSTREKPLFLYLQDCRGETEVVPGDARLALERELAAGQPRKFDILVMDAFSSDSVPVHLLTSEAFQLYTKHLRDQDSIIAVNISNRFLDLADLVASQGEAIGYLPIIAEATARSLETSPSSWMLLTQSMTFVENEDIFELCRPRPPVQQVLWTDTFSNLFSVVR